MSLVKVYTVQCSAIMQCCCREISCLKTSFNQRQQFCAENDLTCLSGIVKVVRPEII